MLRSYYQVFLSSQLHRLQSPRPTLRGFSHLRNFHSQGPKLFRYMSSESERQTKKARMEVVSRNLYCICKFIQGTITSLHRKSEPITERFTVMRLLPASC